MGGNGKAAAGAAAKQPQEEKKAAAVVSFKVHDVVEVEPDTRPGVNRLGGVARVTKVCGKCGEAGLYLVMPAL